MKRFAKMLALGLTLATVFGMSVSASNSPTTYMPSYTPAEDDTVGVTVNEIKTDNAAAGKAAAANDAAKAAVNAALYGDTITNVMEVFNFTVDEKAEVKKVTFKLRRLAAQGEKYILLHYDNWDFAGTPEVIVLTETDKTDANSKDYAYYEAKLTSGSPFVLAKTAEKAYYNSRVFADYIPEGVTKADIYPEDAEKGFAAAGTDAAANQVKSVSAGSGYVWAIDQVLDVWNLSTATAGKYEVIINLPVVDSNSYAYAYALLHYNNWDFTGSPEVILMSCTDVETGKYKATVASGSPFVIVRLQKVAADTDVQSAAANAAADAAATTTQPATQNPAVSPKTGEALPVAAIMALVCLAGAAVCVKKARCNG